jgi:polyisoprenoid-binding protein YceI
LIAAHMKMQDKTMRALTVRLLAAGAMLASAPLALAAPAPVNRDPAKTESGTYALDSRHVGLQAKIGHNNGVSWSVFRFDKVSGTLDWNAANPIASKLTVVVDPKTIQAAAPEFGPELADEFFLNTAKHPEARFVSTRAVQTAPGKGRLTGDLTFYGQTRPMTFDVTFIGSGGSAQNRTMGFHAIGSFKRSDFGYSALMGPVGDEVVLEMDVEFGKRAPRPAAAPAG